MMSLQRVLSWGVLVVILRSEVLIACSVCFGNKEDIMTQSLGIGVLVLLGILCAVLIGVGLLILYLNRKEREMSQIC